MSAQNRGFSAFLYSDQGIVLLKEEIKNKLGKKEIKKENVNFRELAQIRQRSNESIKRYGEDLIKMAEKMFDIVPSRQLVL